MNDALPLVGGRSRPARGRRPPGLRLAPDRCRTLPGRLGGRQHIAEGRRAGLSRALGAGAPGEGQRLRSQIGPEKGLPRCPHGRHRGAAGQRGHGRRGDGGVPRPRPPGGGWRAPVNRDAVARLPGYRGGDPHPCRCRRVAHQQRPGAGGDRVRLRTERGLPRIPAARLPDLERGRRVRARAPRGESPHPGEARDDYLGPDDPRSLRGDGRADQPGGGGHRRAEAGAPCLRRAAGAGAGPGGAAPHRRRARAQAPRAHRPLDPLLRRRHGRAGVRVLGAGRGAQPDRTGHARSHDLHEAAPVLRTGRPRRRPRPSPAGRHARGGRIRAQLRGVLRAPRAPGPQPRRPDAAGRAGPGARHVHDGSGQADGRHRRRHLPPHNRRPRQRRRLWSVRVALAEGGL